MFVIHAIIFLIVLTVWRKTRHRLFPICTCTVMVKWISLYLSELLVPVTSISTPSPSTYKTAFIPSTPTCTMVRKYFIHIHYMWTISELTFSSVFSSLLFHSIGYKDLSWKICRTNNTDLPECDGHHG